MTALGNPLNFIKVSDPRSLRLPQSYLSDGQIPYGVFITGYSAAPDGYAEPTRAYERGLIDNLRAQGKAPVPITSPTVTPDSVDAICTEVAHEKRADILYITAQDYLKYVDPDQLPKTADRQRFINEPKYYFDDKNAYSLASAVTSDVTEVTGGRDTAVSDFMNALHEGKDIILVRNARLPKGFDPVKTRPNNAEEYIENMIEAEIVGNTLPYPSINGFDAHYIDENLERIERLVRVDDIDHPQYLSAPSIESVARASAGISKPASSTQATSSPTEPHRQDTSLGKPKPPDQRLQ